MPDNGKDIDILEKAEAVSRAINSKVDAISDFLIERGDKDARNAIIAGLILQAVGRAKLAGWTEEQVSGNTLAMWQECKVDAVKPKLVPIETPAKVKLS